MSRYLRGMIGGLGVFAIFSLAAPALAGWTMTESSFFTFDQSGNLPLGAEFGFTPIGTTGIKVFGQAGAVGEQMVASNQLFISLSGNNSETLQVGDFIRTAIQFQISTSAGSTVRVMESETFYGFPARGTALYGVRDFGEGQVVSGNFFATYDTDAATRIFESNTPWYFNMRLIWTPQSATDELTITVPSDSIDLFVVPAPGAGVVLAAGFGLVGRRRR